MARLSKEERAELEARLRADDDDDDDGDEVELTHGDATLRGSYRRVSEFAAARGLKLKPDPKPASKADGDEDGKGKRFTNGRRTG